MLAAQAFLLQQMQKHAPDKLDASGFLLPGAHSLGLLARCARARRSRHASARKGLSPHYRRQDLAQHSLVRRILEDPVLAQLAADILQVSSSCSWLSRTGCPAAHAGACRCQPPRALHSSGAELWHRTNSQVSKGRKQCFITQMSHRNRSVPAGLHCDHVFMKSQLQGAAKPA